jgi:hypothetical protein
MKSDPEKLVGRHPELTHSDMLRVVSHVQRTAGEWIINTLMIDGCDTPFRYKRKRMYRSLEGGRVNLTYYPTTELVSGIEMEVMNVVRIRRA